eukprot:COSAG01_NODE_14078_length_1498_cov_36.448892_2_plen_218_part_00
MVRRIQPAWGNTLVVNPVRCHRPHCRPQVSEQSAARKHGYAHSVPPRTLHHSPTELQRSVYLAPSATASLAWGGCRARTRSRRRHQRQSQVCRHQPSCGCALHLGRNSSRYAGGRVALVGGTAVPTPPRTQPWHMCGGAREKCVDCRALLARSLRTFSRLARRLSRRCPSLHSDRSLRVAPSSGSRSLRDSVLRAAITYVPGLPKDLLRHTHHTLSN